VNLEDLQPIITSHLFPLLDEKLIELLDSLTQSDWDRRALPKWTVRDIAAHLLDSNVRRLSIGRDGYWGVPFQGSSVEELNVFLNQLNHEWVQACRRLSPPLLVKLLRETGQQLSEYMQSLDPMGEAILAVSWAGEEQSVAWFDIAREYTEKWHHQQQIRDAVGQPGVLTPALYAPVVATFMRALPHTYRHADAENRTVIQFHVTGESGGLWALVRDDSGWKLKTGRASNPACEVIIPGEIAWKLFTKGLTQEAARRVIQGTGDAGLIEPVFTATAIVG